MGRSRSGLRPTRRRTPQRRREGPSWLNRLFRPARRTFDYVVFSSLTRRILFLNLAGLGILVAGVLYLNQFREGLIEAKVESLRTQSQIIAGAISASASVETNSLQIDPEKLLEIQAGQSINPVSDGLDSLDFPINPERVAPVLRRLISPTRTRARVYDGDANLLIDSRHFYSGGQILRYNLPELEPADPTLWNRIEDFIFDLIEPETVRIDTSEPAGSGSAYSEVISALTGDPAWVVRRNAEGAMIISVAVPIQRFRAVLGSLQLSTLGGDIDEIIAAEQRAILAVFGVAALVTITLSILLASTIATPLQRLSAAAVRVKNGVKEREEIPDFSDRQDEIGNLSVALRAMTKTLYKRMDAIERFAADVAHELKNPLTSLRSAVETLPLARNETSRDRLLDIIQHDVRRLDRLITDISDASRLDAELARADADPVDLERLLGDLVALNRETAKVHSEAEVDLTIERPNSGPSGFLVLGHELRLSQVFSNLIGNARSFVPDDKGHIQLRMSRSLRRIRIAVEDNGPGIRPDALERIFERFYTDRPTTESFGQNSGLGLSISRQIIEAHGGSLTAENMIDENGNTRGARFNIVLPARR